MEKWTRLLVILATVLLLIAFVGVGIRLGMVIHHTLLLFALGGLVAYALDPLVEKIRGSRFGRKTSVSVVFVSLVVILGAGIWLLSDDLVHQITSFSRDYPQYHARALTLAGVLDARLAARHIHFSLTDTLQNPPPDIKAIAANAGKQAVPALRHLVTDLGESLIVLLIALYFLLFSAEMRQKFNALLPPDLRSRTELWQTDVNRILGGFVRGQLIIAVLIGAAAAVGCLAIGIHIWLVIGLVVIVASLIPVFGPYLGAVPAIIAALVGPTHFHPGVSAGLVIALFIAINEGGSKILYPKLVGSALGLHTVLVLFVLFAGLEIDGIVGVLFAAPVTALALVSIVHLYRYWQGLPDGLLSTVARIEGPEQQHAALP